MSYLGNSPGVASQRVESAFTATSSQTVFTPSSGYTLGYCDVYQNGVKLVNGDDYTASNGTTVTLATGAASGDSIVIVASFPRGLSDGYLKSEADAKYVALAGSTMTGVLALTAGSASAPALTTSGDTNTGIAFPAADTVAVATGGTERVRVDSAGNVGVGVVPSAWYTGGGFKALQVGARTSLTDDSGNNNLRLMFNAYYNSAGSPRYLAAAAATSYLQSAGTHQWYNAPAGANAGDAITFTQAMTLDASGNLGVGTTSPATPLDVVANSSALNLRLRGRSSDSIGQMEFWNNAASTRYGFIAGESTALTIAAGTSIPLLFITNGAERARIDSSGRLLVGTTSTLINESSMGVSSSANTCTFKTTGGAGNQPILCWNSGTTGTRGLVGFFTGSSYTAVGAINTDGTTTAYVTSSDYRLKHSISPMTGALAKVAALKPCTYKWNADGSDGEGFIAHELAEVCPQAVTGEKDAVNEDGSIKPQGIDTSFLVATLTAAIQEQQAIITQLQADVATLKGTP